MISSLKVVWLLAAVGCGFGGGFTLSSRLSAADLQELKAEYAQQALDASKAAEEQQATAQLRYAEQARTDAAIVATLEQNLQDINAYIDASPTGGNTCLSGTDTQRLRDLWHRVP